MSNVIPARPSSSAAPVFVPRCFSSGLLLQQFCGINSQASFSPKMQIFELPSDARHCSNRRREDDADPLYETPAHLEVNGWTTRTRRILCGSNPHKREGAAPLCEHCQCSVCCRSRLGIASERSAVIVTQNAEMSLGLPDAFTRALLSYPPVTKLIGGPTKPSRGRRAIQPSRYDLISLSVCDAKLTHWPHSSMWDATGSTAYCVGNPTIGPWCWPP